MDYMFYIGLYSSKINQFFAITRSRTLILGIIKKEGKVQEPIQSSTTSDPVYQWESNKLTIRHHKRW